jgi:hypothetical protein
MIKSTYTTFFEYPKILTTGKTMKKVKFKITAMIGASLLTAVLYGCTQQPKETESDEAQTLVDSMKYVKAKNGLCFGVVTVDRFSSNGTTARNQMIVPAECSKIGL